MGLCLPTAVTDSTSSEESEKNRMCGDSDCSVLVKEVLLPTDSRLTGGHFEEDTHDTGLAVTGPVVAPIPIQLRLSGLEAERVKLRQGGLSEEGVAYEEVQNSNMAGAGRPLVHGVIEGILIPM